MPALDMILSAELDALSQSPRLRELKTSARLPGMLIEQNGRRYHSFTCNDYFGLTHHPDIIRAAQEATERYGTGSAASRLLTGNTPLYHQLESKLAVLKHTEAACVFGSGYLANIGILTALADKRDLILLDRLSHACLLDGARLSGARFMRFKHNDTTDLARILAKERTKYRRCLIVTETIFSMDGDLAPLSALNQLATQHDAWLITDDAHGLGFVSHNPAPIQTGTLSKGAAAYGGYVCGSQSLISWLHNHARSLLFSTGLPPTILSAAHRALTCLETEPQRARHALKHAQMFSAALGLPLAQSPIVPVILGTDEATMTLAHYLKEEGFLVAAIRPPTVPDGTARLRFTFSSSHQTETIAALIAVMQKHAILWKKRAV